MTAAVAAVDLGATSGRVMLGHVRRDELRLVPLARFANDPVPTIDGLHWDILALYRGVRSGLAAALRDEPELRSIGIDSWAVDYALLAGDRMLGNPFHYRDDRTGAGVAAVHERVPPAELYAANGLQFLPFTTVYQLAAEQLAGALDGADSMLLVPDLLGYWLTGERRAERTNASTTGLLDVRTGEWDDALVQRLELPRHLLPELVTAGDPVGALLPEVAAGLGSPAHAGLTVTAVGSHDTASAVVAVPALQDDFAYISSGTWSLVGVELEHPVLSEAGRRAGFTNERGVDGRIRYLQNVSGLWLLSESVRHWERETGASIELPALLDAAAAVTEPVGTFDAADPRFIAPGDLPSRITAWCAEHGVPAPATRPEMVRSILESLAAAYADSLGAAAELAGRTIREVHVVGGGSQNALLCQLTADRTGLPVLAGPVEATALGNVLVQARAQGILPADASLEELRALVARAYPPVRYSPRTRTGAAS